MPVTYVHVNFFDTEILEGISASADTVRVLPSMAQLLPEIEAADNTLVQLTLWDGVQQPEIISVTDNPLTGTLTVLRGQEGTTKKNWQAGTQIMCALTAQVINAALAAYFDINEVLDANFLPLTGGTLTGPLILPAAAPTLTTHATNKAYVDSVLGNKLPLAGGTMAGSINMNSNRILALPEPISPAEPATKAYADDISEVINDINADRGTGLTTAGTATAYTVTTNTQYDTLTDGITILIRPHVVNGAAVTLSADSLTAAPIQAIPGTNLPAGFLRAFAPYIVRYSTTYSAWLLVGLPITATAWSPGDHKWSDQEADHDMWLLKDGRSLLRTDHAALFAAIGTRYGAADATHFNIPKMAGLGLIGRDNIDGTADDVVQISGTITTTNANVNATVGSSVGLSRGMYVLSATVPADTTIVSINGTAIVLSNAATGAATGAACRFSFINDPNLTGRSGGSHNSTLHADQIPSGLTGTTAAVTGVNGGSFVHQEAELTSGSAGSGLPRFVRTTGSGAVTTRVDIPSLTVAAGGGGQAHGNMQPSMTSNAFIYSPR